MRGKFVDFNTIIIHIDKAKNFEGKPDKLKKSSFKLLIYHIL